MKTANVEKQPMMAFPKTDQRLCQSQLMPVAVPGVPWLYVQLKVDLRFEH
jgi:hypothetical protein